MDDIFLYGTLCHAPLLARVLGHAPHAVPAVLPDHRVSWVDGQPFPMIASAPGDRAGGLLLQSLGPDDVARLDFYEGGFSYELKVVTVETETGPRTAKVFFPQAGTVQPGAAWSLSNWVARWGAIAMDQAEEVMARYGRQSADEIARLLPVMRARAWARQLATDSAPATLRRPREPGAVTIDLREGYEGFFRVRRFAVSHRRFDGWQSPILQREAMVSFDVALVLPYDPLTDRVLLVEQLRYGPVLRGDPAPWLLEPVAGFVEAGEDPAQAARREALEETGLDLQELLPMHAAYASPGYSTEFYHCFLALCDLEGAGGLGGAEHEHEDIRAHVVPFEQAMALLDSGEVNAAPLALMLLWLARARPGLRGLA
jgi:nudix-type nucleoside diphosphatase (YffH/AdpP family)